MPRARNKEDLLQFSEENYAKLLKMISAMSENQMSTEFDFSDDAGKKEAHWGRDKNVRDVLIHLYEWHQLLIKFVEHNTAQESKIAFLPPEYSWKTYGAMNVMLWKRHQGTDLETAKKMLAESHRKVMEMAAGFTNEELFTKKYYNWTGTTDLGAYFVSTCSSHYEWQSRRLKPIARRDSSHAKRPPQRSEEAEATAEWRIARPVRGAPKMTKLCIKCQEWNFFVC